MFTIKNQTRAGKIFKCTIFVGYGGVIFFTGVAPAEAALRIRGHFDPWLFQLVF